MENETAEKCIFYNYLLCRMVFMASKMTGKKYISWYVLAEACWRRRRRAVWNLVFWKESSIYIVLKIICLRIFKFFCQCNILCLFLRYVNVRRGWFSNSWMRHVKLVVWKTWHFSQLGLWPIESQDANFLLTAFNFF